MRYVLLAFFFVIASNPAHAGKKKIIQEGLKQLGIGTAGGAAGSVAAGTVLQDRERRFQNKMNAKWYTYCKRHPKDLRCSNPTFRSGDPPKCKLTLC